MIAACMRMHGCAAAGSELIIPCTWKTQVVCSSQGTAEMALRRYAFAVACGAEGTLILQLSHQRVWSSIIRMTNRQTRGSADFCEGSPIMQIGDVPASSALERQARRTLTQFCSILPYTPDSFIHSMTAHTAAWQHSNVFCSTLQVLQKQY